MYRIPHGYHFVCVASSRLPVLPVHLQGLFLLYQVVKQNILQHRLVAEMAACCTCAEVKLCCPMKLQCFRGLVPGLRPCIFHSIGGQKIKYLLNTSASVHVHILQALSTLETTAVMSKKNNTFPQHIHENYSDSSIASVQSPTVLPSPWNGGGTDLLPPSRLPIGWKLPQKWCWKFIHLDLVLAATYLPGEAVRKYSAGYNVFVAHLVPAELGRRLPLHLFFATREQYPQSGQQTAVDLLKRANHDVKAW